MNKHALIALCLARDRVRKRPSVHRPDGSHDDDALMERWHEEYPDVWGTEPEKGSRSHDIPKVRNMWHSAAVVGD